MIRAIAFCCFFAFPLFTSAQVRTWVILTEDGAIHKKYRYTGGACQKVEVWEYIFGGAHKLSVQAPNPKPAKAALPNPATPTPLPCPAFAQWDTAPVAFLKDKAFDTASMSFSSPKDQKLEQKLTITEGFQAVGQEIEMHFNKQHPDLKKVLEDFQFNLLIPLIQNEKAHATSAGLSIYIDITSEA